MYSLFFRTASHKMSLKKLNFFLSFSFTKEKLLYAHVTSVSTRHLHHAQFYA